MCCQPEPQECEYCCPEVFQRVCYPPAQLHYAEMSYAHRYRIVFVAGFHYAPDSAFFAAMTFDIQLKLVDNLMLNGQLTLMDLCGWCVSSNASFVLKCDFTTFFCINFMMPNYGRWVCDALNHCGCQRADARRPKPDAFTSLLQIHESTDSRAACNRLTADSTIRRMPKQSCQLH